MTPAEFIAEIGPPAQQSAAATKVPASFVVAEAALESGWGSSGLVVQANNLFGVKADPSWRGSVLVMNTREFYNGQWVMVPARWRKYADYLGSIGDHAAFLRSNQRYSRAFMTGDAESFVREVAAAGYATDPCYADKIIALMREHNLGALDNAIV